MKSFFFKTAINFEERNSSFIAWLRSHQRGGWVDAFQAIVSIPENILDSSDFDDLVEIFSSLKPMETPPENTDDLVAMFSGLSL